MLLRSSPGTEGAHCLDPLYPLSKIRPPVHTIGDHIPPFKGTRKLLVHFHTWGPSPCNHDTDCFSRVLVFHAFGFGVRYPNSRVSNPNCLNLNASLRRLIPQCLGT